MGNKKSFMKGALYGALIMLLVVTMGGCVWNTANNKSRKEITALGDAQSNGEAMQKMEGLGALIDKYYLFSSDIKEEQLQDGIYKGYVSGLGDPYTVYYNEEETTAMMESTTGEYSGVGAIVSQDINTGLVTVAGVYEDSPAEEAGLLDGDILFKVDDREITDEDLNEVVSWIKGEEGSEVTIYVYRGDALEEVACKATRRKIEAHTVEHEMKPDQIGYIRVVEFDSVTLDQFKGALTDLENQGMKGLVIDLRGNPGGNLDTTVDMLKLILPKGTVVSTEDKEGNKEDYVNEQDHTFQKPLAVLVNQNSASASEVFSGAVQDYGVGTIVGATTYGKGIVQQLIDLGDGTSLKVTISEYFTPKGRSIHDKGVTPDVEVEFEADPNDGNADNQLQKAIEVIEQGIGVK